MANKILQFEEVEFSQEEVNLSQGFAVNAQMDIEDKSNEETARIQNISSEAFLESAKKDRAILLQKATLEAQEILKTAQIEAAGLKEEANVLLSSAQTQQQTMQKEQEDLLAQKEQDLLKAARKKALELKKEAQEEARREGHEQGYQEALKEFKRLNERMQKYIAQFVRQKEQLLSQSESQMVGIVLQIAKKVIKTSLEADRNLVLKNIQEALKRLKDKTKVYLHLNIDDIPLLSQEKRKIIAEIEKIKELVVVEDPHVDRGGCLIKTDLGYIDARIHSQFNEIADRVLETTPQLRG